ncbi:hypothetical protein PC118_g18299, partial [Phytophthora cactorum]
MWKEYKVDKALA